MRNTKRKALFLAAATVGLLQANTGSGATFTWNGASNSLMSLGGNWVGGVAPSANDFLLFDGSSNTSVSNNYAAGTAFAGIGFTSGASTFTISGNALQIGPPT